MKIPHNPVYLTGKEQQYIAEAIASGNLCGDGFFTKNCESWLSETLHSERVLLTHSCTAALEMAVHLCGVGPGDEVIMPSFTFSSTATAVVQRGATPVFVDIDPLTCNIDPQNVEKAIGPKTRCIIVVHYAGFPCSMGPIMDIANRYSIRVIEDAAQGLLSKYDGKCLGTIGHFGCMSFHESKNIQCGEGGALFINDPSFIDSAEIMREKGTNRAAFFRGQIDKYTWIEAGSSYIPSELNAAFLWAQLQAAHWVTDRKVERLFHYHQQLAPLTACKKITLPPLLMPYAGNGHICYILTGSLSERTRLICHLRNAGIGAYYHYIPLHSSPAGKKYCRVSGSIDVTNRVSDCLLRLPIYPHMALNDVDAVSANVLDFYG